MRLSRRLLPLRRLLLCLAVAPTLSYGWFFGPGWPELTEEERNLAAPRIDPEAGAEVLYREVSLDDRQRQRVLTVLMRVKVFDQRGVDAMKKIELEAWGEDKVRKVKARIVRPDGTIEELERSAVHHQESIRWGRFRHRQASFALPGVTPGCIIDYRYDVTTPHTSSSFRFFTLHEMPTHQLRFRMRYMQVPGWVGAITYADLPERPLVEKGTWWELEQSDLPARADEPYLPPRSAIEPWVMIFYRQASRRDDVDHFWDQRAKDLRDFARKEFNPTNRAIRAKARELTEGIEDPEEQLRAIYDFCAGDIRNLLHPDPDVAGGIAGDRPEADKPVEVLEYGYGTPYYINTLFGSLAGAAGFESTFAACSDRSKTFFDTNMTYWDALPDLLVAVRTNKDQPWRFFDPGQPLMPFGALHWTNEAAIALVLTNKKADFVKTPVRDSRQSKIARRGMFVLAEDGALSGTAHFAFTGHVAQIWRKLMGSTPDEERPDLIRDDLLEGLSQVEVSDLRIENLHNAEAPLQIQFGMKVPQFGDRTSRRLFFTPLIFVQNQDPLFETEEREHGVYLPFVWNEEDYVKLVLPDGYELEEAEAPASVVNQPVLRHHTQLAYVEAERTLHAQRLYEVAGHFFASEHYAALKLVHDEIHRQDNHLLTLQRVEAGANDSPVATKPAAALLAR